MPDERPPPSALAAAGTPSALPAATLLQLIWLASPALPVGGFSYSEGLEGAVECGLVVDEASTATWLLDQIELGAARADWPLFNAAFEAWRHADAAAIGALNSWFASTRESAELARQAAQMGRSLALWVSGLHAQTPGLDVLLALEPAPAWPIAFAFAAARTEATGRDALLAFAFGWAENMVQAAVKAVPLGQSAGQRVLARLLGALPAAVERALVLPADEWQAFMPMFAVLSARHESQYSRLFRS